TVHPMSDCRSRTSRLSAPDYGPAPRQPEGPVAATEDPNRAPDEEDEKPDAGQAQGLPHPGRAGAILVGAAVVVEERDTRHAARLGACLVGGSQTSALLAARLEDTDPVVHAHADGPGPEEEGEGDAGHGRQGADP